MFWFFTLLAFIPNAPAQNLNDSLIVHYPLDGNANDIGPNALHGIYYASAATDCSGGKSRATYFNGTNSYMALPNNPLMKPQLPVTISFRIKVDNNYAFQQVLGTDNFLGNYKGFWVRLNQQRIAISFGDGTGVSPNNRRTKVGNVALRLNKWYTITVTINNPHQFSLYINCLEDIGQHTGSGGSLSYSNVPGDLGRNSYEAGYNYFHGYLDEFRMWNRILTKIEIQQLANYHCFTDTLSKTICYGDSASINLTTYYKTSGIYTDTITKGNGSCDSLKVLKLNVLSQNRNTIFASICKGDTFFFQGRQFSSAGVYSDTTKATNSCDSIIVLNLSVNTVHRTSSYLNICNGDTFYFNGKPLSQAGKYIDTLLSSTLCDSIVSLYLTIMPKSFTKIHDTICSGESYNLNGKILRRSGIYVDTVQSSNSCDSVITLNLIVLPRKFTSLRHEICQGDTFFFNGQTLTSKGRYTDTLQASNSCDSIVALNLRIKRTRFSTNFDSIYSNGSFLFNQEKITKAGIFHDTTIASNGCDSIITLFLKIKYPRGIVAVGICSGDTIAVNSSLFHQTGSYTDTLLGAASNGADSLLSIVIYLLPVDECYPLNLTIPNIFTPNGDGILDELMIEGENIAEFQLQVFSRWGELVHETNNISNTWDGRKDGKKCSNGNYFYIVRGKGLNGKKFEHTGWIILIR